jgi:TRAP-type C4-dicarboxylate transport system permease small subunit
MSTSGHETEQRRLCNWLDYPLVGIGAAGLLLMMFATLASTIGNAIFSRPVPDIVTLDEVLMAFVVFLPLAYVQLHRDHIEVTLATDWLPPRPKSYLRRFAIIVSIVTFSLLAWALAGGAHDAWADNDIYTGEYDIPSWPMRLIAAIGTVGFVIRLCVDLVQEWRTGGTTDDSLPNKQH